MPFSAGNKSWKTFLPSQAIKFGSTEESITVPHTGPHTELCRVYQKNKMFKRVVYLCSIFEFCRK